MTKQLTLLSIAFILCSIKIYGQSITDFEQAQKAIDDRDQARILENFIEITKENIYNGDHWFERAKAEVRLGKYEASIASAAISLEHGYNVKLSKFLIGYSYAQLKVYEKAKEQFEQVIKLDPSWFEVILAQSNLTAFHNSIPGQRLFGKADSAGIDRKEQWIKDLTFLSKTIETSHYNSLTKTNKETWANSYQTIQKDIPSLSDAELYLNFMKYTAQAGDGHTCIWPISSDRFKFQMLPASIYPFDDGFYFKYTDEQHKAYVGAKVLRIGKLSIEEIFDKIEPFAGHENLMHRKLLSPNLLGNVQILKMIGAIDDIGKVNIEIEQEGRKQIIFMDAIPLDYPSLSTNHMNPNQWIPMNSHASHPLPLWLRHPEKYYWYNSLENLEAIYFQYNNILEHDSLSFDAFCKELFVTMKSKKTKTLIIDIRMNEGGSTPLYYPLLKQLLSHENQLEHLFVIIGRRTYSAAMNLATDLEHWTNAIFIGEPTGSSPNFIGENKIFKLPYSQIQVSVSDRYHQRGASNSQDKRVWIAPDVYIGLNSSDFAKNIDPVMNAIREYLQK